MSTIFRRDANSTSNVQQYEENLSATSYKSLILLLRYLHVAEDEGVLNKVKSIVGDATPYRAEMKRKRFVEQLICPEEELDSVLFDRLPITNGETQRLIGWQGINWQCAFRILTELDASYADMISFTDKDFPKLQDLPEDIQEMYELIDSLPEIARDGFIRESAQSMISTMWRHRFWSDQTKKVMLRPATRVQYVFARRCSIKRKEILNLDERIQKNEEPFDIDDKQKEIIHELARIMFVRASLTTCNEKQLPHIAATFGVSLHWLMGMPSTLRLYAKHSATEDIIDAYYFMPAANKTEFKRAVKKFVAKLAEMEAEKE